MAAVEDFSAAVAADLAAAVGAVDIQVAAVAAGLAAAVVADIQEAAVAARQAAAVVDIQEAAEAAHRVAVVVDIQEVAEAALSAAAEADFLAAVAALAAERSTLLQRRRQRRPALTVPRLQLRLKAQLNNNHYIKFGDETTNKNYERVFFGIIQFLSNIPNVCK